MALKPIKLDAETRKELSEYEKARIQYRDCDYKNGIDTAIREGSKEGSKEGFKKAELATFTPDERRDYVSCCYAYSDLKKCFETAIREGRKEGLREGLREGFEKVSIDVARELKTEGISIAQISRITGLPEEKIEGL